jgi:hypothetical protein
MFKRYIASLSRLRLKLYNTVHVVTFVSTSNTTFFPAENCFWLLAAVVSLNSNYSYKNNRCIMLALTDDYEPHGTVCI